MKRHENIQSTSEQGAERPETVCFSDGETAHRIDKPGQQLNIAPLLDRRLGNGGGMLGSDGALAEALVVTETGSVYYLRGGMMVNMKDGEASDQYAESDSRKRENESFGQVIVGKPLFMADRKTSPVVGVYYNYDRKVFSDEADPNASDNPFPQCREAMDEAMKDLRPEQYQKPQALQRRLGKGAVR